MTQLEKRIKIAEAMGYKNVRVSEFGTHPPHNAPKPSDEPSNFGNDAHTHIHRS